MKRIFLALLSALVLLAGCSAAEVTLDLDAVAQELLARVEFVDELDELSSKKAMELYKIEDAIAAKVYIGSGATTEEIALFELSSEEAAKTAHQAALHRIERQKEDYSDYAPQELPRLNNAEVRQVGRYVLVCVSASDAAGDVFDACVK